MFFVPPRVPRASSPAPCTRSEFQSPPTTLNTVPLGEQGMGGARVLPPGEDAPLGRPEGVGRVRRGSAEDG